jgi:hypothetical protein
VLYLLQGTNQRLKEKLVRELRPGARVVSHSSSVYGGSPVALDDSRGIFLHEVGRTGPEGWTKLTWRGGPLLYRKGERNGRSSSRGVRDQVWCDG